MSKIDFVNMSYIKEKEEHIETVMDAREDAGDQDTQRIIQTPNTGLSSVWSRCYRVTAVCVLLLSVLLLIAVTVLWIKFNILNTENNQLQTRYNNLTIDKDQLQTRYNNLTIDKDQLQTRYNNLTIDKDQLQTRYNNLTIDRDQLQTRYNNLTIDRDQLQTRYNNLTIERDQLQTRYNNLTVERDQLKLSTKDLQRYSQAGWIYYNSSLYYISNGWRNWTYSREYCRGSGADMLIINSLEEQTFVKKVLCTSTWIGLSYIGREGVWNWVDGTKLTTSFWAPGEPNNNTGNEDCVMTSGFSGLTFNWADCPCNSTFKFMCEKTLII